MTARTRFFGAIFALSFVSAPVSGLYDRAYRSLTKSAGCTDARGEVEAEWEGLGEWRSLAPYPTPREASPTKSVGVWLERSHLDGGTTELRRVSAERTDVAQFDDAGCLQKSVTHMRSFNQDSLRDAFTDVSLKSLMAANARGMIYVWSPRMPLSIKGLAEARSAAKTLGIAFTALAAEANDAELDEFHAAPANRQRMESLELVYRNATIHYPSVLLYDNTRIIDGVYPGYKNRETYAMYAREKFADQRFTAPNTSSVAAFWVDHKARVTTISAVNTPRRIGFFFKPISGTTLVSYNAAGKDFFFDITTSKELPVPGHIDPVPTPDGRFLTLPGLHFHPVPALLAGDDAPMYTDRQLPDEYQTASILSETKAGVRYRVVTGWNAGARFRDYDVVFDKKGAATSVEAIGEPFVPCKDRLLTLPINAKSGREFGAFDARTKTDLVLEVADSTHCNLKLDLGFASGKISFSYDGAFIAFATSRINTDATGDLIRPSEAFYKDALALERKTGRIVSLSQNAGIAGMTFPEFQKNGTVMLLDQYGPGRPVEQLKVVSFK